MFENFPYTDMHQLNLDWIIKIAKDFLDQYTHLQQLISDGEASLQNLTDEGVRTLVTKTDDLEKLLNEWYDTHSQDIADQLADALNDLNTWYDVHQNYLDQTLTQNISLFNQRAEAKAAETIATIPDDYTDIANSLKQINKVSSELLTTKTMLIQSGYIDTTGAEASNNNYVRSYFIPVDPLREGIILYNNMWGNNGVVNILSFYDSEKTYISGIAATGQLQTDNNVPPANAKFVRFSTLKQYIDENKTVIKITPNFPYDYHDLLALLLPFIENGQLFTLRGYVNNGSEFYGNSAFVRTPYIPVMGGDTFYYYNLIGNANAISVVSLFDINKNPISHIQSTGVYQTGSIQATQEGYIIFSCNKTYVDSGAAYIRFINNVNNRFNINLQHRRYVTENDYLTTIGDSITAQTWAADADKWQSEVTKYLKMNSSFNNMGFDGYKVSGPNGLWTDAVLDLLPANSGVIIVMAGINDWANNVPIGNKSFDNTDTDTFFGACNVLFRKLTGRKTASRIVAFGTTFACCPNRENFNDPIGFKNNLGLISLDYSRIMMESAQLNGIEHYDIGGNLCINTGNYTNYYRDQSIYVHPNATMTVMIGSFIAKKLG